MHTSKGRLAFTQPQAEEWLARGRAWLNELRTPIGLRASSLTGRYHALFGRDSLWSLILALEASRLLPRHADLAGWVGDLAGQCLRALAATQGTATRDENEEQPGKIVHEYWPETPEHLRNGHWPLVDGRYYGSVDGTYLYLLAVARVWEQVAGGRDLIESLWDSVMAALQWALEYAPEQAGLVVVQPRQPQGLGLRNQIWKDSDDPALLADGSPLQPPVAWVEVQGYAIATFRHMGALLQARHAEPALQQELARRFTRLEQGLPRFWLAEENCPAMLLTREQQPLPLVSSNIGHLLWCDALQGPPAGATATRLMQPDLLTGWGLRTLSSRSASFDPESYHRGSVWPFDTAIAAGALWRMGRRADALLMGERVLAALAHFGTPVELYCVLPPGWQDGGTEETLAAYPGACDLQAWSAAGVLLFAAQMLAG